ncbi:MAG: DUF4235 domain-containing protein [Nocardioidaceae bacterium]
MAKGSQKGSKAEGSQDSKGSKGSKIWSVYGLGATVLATFAARKAMTATWKLATRKEPPQNPAHPDVSMGEAVAWAAASGVAVGLARMLASRKAADYYRRSTGHLPPNLEDVEV